MDGIVEEIGGEPDRAAATGTHPKPQPPGRASTTARILGLAASITLCVLLPVAMVIANKSAPVALAAGTVLANLAVISAGHTPALLARYRRLLTGGSGLMIMAFFVWAAITLVWSVSPAMTLRGLRETLPELLFGWGLAAAWPLAARRAHLALFGLGIVAAGALITFEGYAGMPLHELVGARALSFDLKRSSIPPLLLLWPALQLCREARQGVRGVVLLGFALLGSLVSHSSASVVAVVVGAAVYGLGLRQPRTSGMGLIGVLLALLIVAPWTGTVVSRFMSPGVERLLREQHAEQRIAIWTTFERRVWDRRWLGHGFDTSFRLGDPVAGGAPSAGNDVIRDIHPHNQLLQVWIDFGTVGAIGVLAALGRLTRKLPRRDAGDAAPRLAFISGVTVLGLVGVQAWDAWWLATLAVTWAAFTVLDQVQPASSHGG